MMNDAEKEDEKKEEAEKDAMMQELHNLDNVDEGDDVSVWVITPHNLSHTSDHNLSHTSDHNLSLTIDHTSRLILTGIALTYMWTGSKFYRLQNLS